MTATRLKALVRRARPDEAEALNELIMRAKSYWGYDQAFLEACRPHLLLTPEAIEQHPVYCAEVGGVVAGVLHLIVVSDAEIDLDHLFVEPTFIGHGIGGILWRHALALARSMGATSLVFGVDPHAQPFYEHMGAVVVLPDQSQEITHMEGLQKHTFPGPQRCLDVRMRCEDDDLRRHPEESQPSCAHATQEVCRLMRTERTQIEEQHRRQSCWYHSLLFPGEDCLPIDAHHLTVACQVQHPTEQLTDRWLLLCDHDERLSLDSICTQQRHACVVSIFCRSHACFLLYETRPSPAECCVPSSTRSTRRAGASTHV